MSNERLPAEDVIESYLDIASGPRHKPTAEGCIAVLRAHGYIIIHPDDVPVRDYRGNGSEWNECRRFIFGDPS